MKKEKEAQVVPGVTQENFKVTLNRILVQVFKEEEEQNGIIRPKSTIGIKPYVKAISVGPQVQEIKVGDLLFTSDLSNRQSLVMYGVHYLMLADTDVRAVVTPEVAYEVSGENKVKEPKEEVKPKPTPTSLLN